jgi:hypothetical protein
VQLPLSAGDLGSLLALSRGECQKIFGAFLAAQSEPRSGWVVSVEMRKRHKTIHPGWSNLDQVLHIYIAVPHRGETRR